ncbi:MAG: heparinase II/III family protein [Candidatus Brocadiia bacterium]
MRRLLTILALAGLTAVATAQNTITKSSAVVRPAEQAPAADRPDSTGLYNAALLELGATARGSGAVFNRDWPPDNALEPGLWNGGTIFDKSGSLKGGRVDIRLLIPVDIKAIEVVGLDYHGTRQPKAISIFVEGKLVKDVDLQDAPGQVQRIELEARGQNVGILVTDDYTNPVDYGGWLRLRVLTTTNVAEKMKPPAQYDVKASPANLVPTGASAAEDKVEVVGQPRMTQGHPCTLWDEEDIAHYKDMLKTSQELQAQYAGLKKAMDIRMTQPLGIPQPVKAPDGTWMHLIDNSMSPSGQTYGAVHNGLGLDIANLGTVYAFSGEEKYAEFCKKLLLAYADVYPNYGVGARPGFNHDPSKVFDQRLSDAIWLTQVARGYDLIHNSPSITPAERKHIEDDLIRADGRFITENYADVASPTNWSAIDMCAVLTAGYACNDEKLLNIAFYGLEGTKEKPTGGLFERHFTQPIDVDGMWAEGAIGYQFMALEALVMDAEVLWHHGIDMYRFHHCALKQLFDSPLRFAYPDLTTPATHDSGRGSIVSGESFLYEFAYRRYRDPSYLLILNQTGRHLDAHFQQFPVSVLYDRDPKEKQPAVEWKSVNFFGVGYGILRLTTAAGINSLLLEYGPDRSHGHPDKLCLDLYAFNDQLMMDPGSVWYELPLYLQWYHSTLAHNTLVVDERNQVMCGATQLVYAPADTMGMQRASCRDAYPGVIMDRAVFMTPDYVADLFGAFASLQREYDLAWHIRGQFASDLTLDPITLPEPREVGYVALTNVRKAAPSDQAWTATVTRGGNVARFLAAGGTQTEVIVGDGRYGLETPPAILERREAAATVYGNAIDISGGKEGYVKGVKQEGSLEAGYGLLKVETAKGTDLCFASYRPGKYQAGALETDAQQAFMVMDGQAVKAMYLGGGKLLKAGGSVLERSEPGLACIEKAETGAYVLSNPSPSDATVTVTFAPLRTMEAFNLDVAGRRSGAATVSAAADSFSVQMKAMSKVEFAPRGAVSVYDQRQAVLQQRQAEQEAAIARAHDECVARTKVREAEAQASPAPANAVVVVQGRNFSGQGGGEVTTATTKRAVASGTCIIDWDAQGHWLEWTFDVPAEGYYNLTLCYCSELDLAQLQIMIGREEQEPFAPMIFPSTGGWANGSDDWRLFTAVNPTNDKPLLLKFKQGKNVVRLMNLNGRGIDVDYVAVTSPDVKATRELLAANLRK